MNMYRFMLIGVEVEDKSKVFEYLRHSFRFNVSAAKIGIIPETSKKKHKKTPKRRASEYCYQTTRIKWLIIY